MAQVVYAEAALVDLERLSDFLLDKIPAEAEETAELIISAVDILVQHPLIGRPVEHGLRELVISRGRTGYSALYSLEDHDETTLVLRIRHQREAGYLATDRDE